MTAYTWTGAAGDGNYGTAGNWLPNGVPGPADDASILVAAGPIAATGSYEVNSLILSSTVVFNVSGSFVIDGTDTVTDPTGSSSNAGLVNVGDGAALSLAGDIVNTGSILLNGYYSDTELVVSGTATLDGGGSIGLVSGGNDTITGGGTLDNANNLIYGDGTIGGIALINAGTVDATFGVLTLATVSDVNTGTLASTGGNLDIDGNVANSGGTIVALGSAVVLGNGATIADGTLMTGGGNMYVSGTAALDGAADSVANTGTLQVNDGSALGLAGEIDNTGSILLNGYYSDTELVVASAVTLSGGGSLGLLSSGNDTVTGGGTLDNADNLIFGDGTIGGVAFINAGTVEAAFNTLTLATLSDLNTGTLVANGGDLDIYSDVGNVGGTIEALGNTVYLGNGATVSGGVLATTGGSMVVRGAATLDGMADKVANTGALQVSDGSALSLAGDIDNTGTILLEGYYYQTALIAGGDVTLAGGGAVGLVSGGNDTITGGGVLRNTDNLIYGSGTIGGVSLINAGTVDATFGALTLATLADVNTGTLAATGGNLDIASDVGNAGGTIVAYGSAVNLENGATVTGGLLATDGGGMYVNGAAVLHHVHNAGALQVDDGSTLGLNGNIDNSGSIQLNGYYYATELVVSGTTTLSGGGAVALASGGNDTITGGGVLDNANNVIFGAGTIGGVTLINAGVVDANGALTLATLSDVNTGTLAATGGNLVIASDVNNAGGTIDALSGQVNLQNGAIITGGVLATDGGGMYVNGAATLADVTNAGTLQVDDGSAATLNGSIDNTGSILLNGYYYATELVVSGTSTLSGGGAVALASGGNDTITGGGTLDNANNVISGAGTIGGVSLINAGIVDANGGALTLATLSDVNTGRLEATGGNLVIVSDVSNAGGTIDAFSGAVNLENGATITGGVLATDGGGMYVNGGATLASLTNAGTVQVDDGSALTLAGGVTSTGAIQLNGYYATTELVIDGGSHDETGAVTGNGTIDEVAGSASFNDLSAFTGSFLMRDGFAEIGGSGIGGNGLTFDVMAGSGEIRLDASLLSPGETLAVPIVSFSAANDVLDLGGLSAAGATVTLSGNDLIVSNGSEAITLVLQGPEASQYYVYDDGRGGVLVTPDANPPPCFVAGTMILTAQGEVPVEAIAAGDLVVTAAGAEVAVSWAGDWEVDLDAYPKTEAVRPVRIMAGALGGGLPRRDLYVSPDHGLYLDGVLVPAKLLVNGTTVTQPARQGTLRYFHLEVEPHEILLAEGAGAESFLDTGYTSFAKPDAPPKSWEDACAPLVLAGPHLERIRSALAAVLPAA